FFGRELARELIKRGERADVLVANNVLAHVPDVCGFVEGISAILKEGGLASIEVPYARDMVERCEFDTIYHEHLCYFALTPLQRLFAANGLTIVDVRRLPIHGGSLRIYAERSGSARAPSLAVLRCLEEEFEWGVGTNAPYEAFANRVQHLRLSLAAMLHGLKSAGHRIAAYGAAAKGATLLNVIGVGA